MTTAPQNPAHDEILAQILESLTLDFRAGKEVRIHDVVRSNPGLESDIRELWGTLLVAEELAKPPGQIARTIAADLNAKAAAPLHRPNLEDYEVLEELGRGGMGIVYKARQRSLGRIVAMKLLLKGARASAVDIARFRAEAESAARLDHPNIAPVYEVGSSSGELFFTMRFVEGTTLARKLLEGPLQPREAARIVALVAHAIHFAHHRGVLHRDLKPQNILLDAKGTPFVTDFGLAKRLEVDDGLTQSGAIVGTPSYMAPEQAAGKRGAIGPTSDVYALGAILYHALTGRPPHQAATPVETVLSVLERDPLPPRLLNPRADRDLEMIALKCLQKPPDLRYPSAQALADDLNAYLQGEPVKARSSGLRMLVNRALRDTVHAPVLENWGLLWMWHSVVLVALCALTNFLHWAGIRTPGPYVGIWTVGFSAWAAIFWALRRRAGPITFVEKQIAHVWGASILAISVLFPVERLLGLEALTLSPILALVNGMVFFVKAGILTGVFYGQAFASFLTAIVITIFPKFGILIFGLVSAACFFIPGWKYHRQRRKAGY